MALDDVPWHEAHPLQIVVLVGRLAELADLADAELKAVHAADGIGDRRHQGVGHLLGFRAQIVHEGHPRLYGVGDDGHRHRRAGGHADMPVLHQPGEARIIAFDAHEAAHLHREPVVHHLHVIARLDPSRPGVVGMDLDGRLRPALAGDVPALVVEAALPDFVDPAVGDPQFVPLRPEPLPVVREQTPGRFEEHRLAVVGAEG